MGTMGLAPVAGARAQMVAAATLAAIGKTVAGTARRATLRGTFLAHDKKDIFGGYCCWACESTNGLASPCHRESEPAEESLGNGDALRSSYQGNGKAPRGTEAEVGPFWAWWMALDAST